MTDRKLLKQVTRNSISKIQLDLFSYTTKGLGIECQHDLYQYSLQRFHNVHVWSHSQERETIILPFPNKQR